MYINGSIENIGVIAKFILYINMLVWPVASIGWVSSLIQEAEASQKRINEHITSLFNCYNRRINRIPSCFLHGTHGFFKLLFWNSRGWFCETVSSFDSIWSYIGGCRTVLEEIFRFLYKKCCDYFLHQTDVLWRKKLFKMWNIHFHFHLIFFFFHFILKIYFYISIVWS